MATINFLPKQTRTALGHTVYLRSDWKAAWEAVPYLFCDTATWSLAPSIGTAQLSWRYGRGMRQGEQALKNIDRLADKRRLYVKIEIECHAVDVNGAIRSFTGDGSDALRWYGTVELDGRQKEGLIKLADGTHLETGMQPLHCVGLEHALHRHFIRGASWLDRDQATVRRAERTFIFNRPGPDGEARPNRAPTRGPKSYAFNSAVEEPDEDVTPGWWSSRDIVEYLATYEVPRGRGDLEQIRLRLAPDELTRVPNWDRPIVDPHRQTTAEILNQLLPRSRMLSWRIRVDDVASVETVWLEPISLFGAAVRTDLGTFAANPWQHNLQTLQLALAAPDAPYTIKESDLQTIDQARVRGARRTSTCTLSHGDGNWELRASAQQISLYDAGASTHGSYASMSDSEKKKANSDVRESDLLNSTYRFFGLPGLWNQTAQGNTVFLSNETTVTAPPYPVCHAELELAPTLPLKDGYDYRDLGPMDDPYPPVRTDARVHSRTPSMVFFAIPGEADKYIQVEAIGKAFEHDDGTDTDAPRNWSGRVEVPPHSRGLTIDVIGKPQHVLAFSDFTGVAADADLGEWDWRDALFTVCILDDRHAEGVWPSDAVVKQSVVTLRRELVVYAGDGFRLDYLVPETVIGLATTSTPGARELVRCNGGGWINDDRKPLYSRARQLFEYYRQPRRSLVMETPIVNSALDLGDYISEFGLATAPIELGTVISQIEVQIPSGEKPDPPTIRYETAFAELDHTEIILRKPGGSARG